VKINTDFPIVFVSK